MVILFVFFVFSKKLVCHLFSSSEQKRNGETEILGQLGCSTAEYYDMLLKNVSISCFKIVTSTNVLLAEH